MFEIIREGRVYPLGHGARGTATTTIDGPWFRPDGLILPDGNLFFSSFMYDGQDVNGNYTLLKILGWDFTPKFEYVIGPADGMSGAEMEMISFAMEDHTVGLVLMDYEGGNPVSEGSDNNYESWHLFVFDCRDGRIELINHHNFLPSTDATSQGRWNFPRDRQPGVVRMREYNLTIVILFRTMLAIRHNQVVDIAFTPFPSGGWGYYYGEAVSPTDPSKFAFLDGDGSAYYEFQVTKEGTIVRDPSNPLAFYFETISTNADFEDGNNNYVMAGGNPYDEFLGVIAELGDSPPEMPDGYPLVLKDRNGTTLVQMPNVPGENLSNWDDLGSVNTGPNQFFFAHMADFWDDANQGWGVDAGVAIRWGHITGGETYNAEWGYIKFFLTQQNQAGEYKWDSFNGTAGSSVSMSYKDGYVLLTMDWLSDTVGRDAAELPVYYTMVYAWLIKVNDGASFKIRGEDDNWLTIGEGVSPERGQLNLKISSSTWHHEWTTQDDIDNPEALRYPLKIKLTDEGPWKVVATMTGDPP